MSYEHANVYHRIKTVENYSEIHLEALRFVEANYGNRIALTDFVKEKGFSQRQTQRALAFYDTNWQRLVLTVRMQRAKELLQHSGQSIGEIASMVGYDHSQFTRTFTAEEGMGPEEYRTWIRQNQSTT